MPVFQFNESLAAGTTNNNIMAGSKFEFLPRDSVIRFYAAQDTGDLCQADISLGNVVVGEDLRPFAVTAAEGPDRDKHLLAQAVGAAGDRIQIRTRETGGAAAAVYRFLVDIVDL